MIQMSFLERVARKGGLVDVAEKIRADRERAEMKRHDMNMNPKMPEYHEKSQAEKSRYTLADLRRMGDSTSLAILRAAEQASRHPDFARERAVKEAERHAERLRIAEAVHAERVKNAMKKGGGAFSRVLRLEE